VSSNDGHTGLREPASWPSAFTTLSLNVATRLPVAGELGRWAAGSKSVNGDSRAKRLEKAAGINDDAINEGLQFVRKTLASKYVKPDERESVKSAIKQHTTYEVIDKVSVKLVETHDKYWASLSNLNLDSQITTVAPGRLAFISGQVAWRPGGEPARR
jgi:BREX system Lon protease-like protein BrxL N-terminal